MGTLSKKRTVAVKRSATRKAATTRKLPKATMANSSRRAAAPRVDKSAPAPAPRRRPARARPFVIDFHAHVVDPAVVAFSKGHVINTAEPNFTGVSQEAITAWRNWRAVVDMKMTDPKVRLADMDKLGIDMQVLTPSLVHQYTYWADPADSLAMEQRTNNRIAEMVAKAPDRFVGLGGVPLQDPALAVSEMRRCVGELGLRGIEVSSHAEPTELGDPSLRVFWAEAEKLGAVIYLHPSGVAAPRYQKFQLWNSVGQPLEEALAMSSLFYEGVLDAYPKLKICVAHGGGYLPFYTGRVDRNFANKGFTRIHMTKSPTQYLREHFWYDTCLYNEDMLEFLVKKVGSSRLVLGSDYPVGEADPIGFVRRARGLSSADKADILGRNAAALLGLSL